MKYEIDTLAGRVFIKIDDFCEIRFSRLHNKAEVWDYCDEKEEQVFKKDFTNVVGAFHYAKSLAGE